MANITGSLSAGGPWGMLAGAGLQVFGNMFNKNEEKRRREIEVEQALQQNQATRERINAMSPEANFRQKQMMLRDGRSNAMQAAGNVAGGSVANSGMGGDYSSGKIAAMKASPMMAQATGQYDMQMANAVDQRQAQEDQKTGMLEQNTSQRAQISQMTDYINRQKRMNTLDGIMSGALAGATAYNMLGDLGKQDINGKKPENNSTQGNIDIPIPEIPELPVEDPFTPVEETVPKNVAPKRINTFKQQEDKYVPLRNPFPTDIPKIDNTNVYVNGLGDTASLFKQQSGYDLFSPNKLQALGRKLKL